MPDILKGWLVGALFVFVVWCVIEAVVQYRHERKMQRMDKAWRWARIGGIRPLFHEQRRKDEVFGEDV